MFAQDKWEHVFRKERLDVLDSNVTITGTVNKVHSESDGDFHIQIKVDSAFYYMLNKENIKFQDGCLVIEIICAKKKAFSFLFCACKNYENDVALPNVGDRVRITGPWVYDRIHGWNEIHPVNSLELISPMSFFNDDQITNGSQIPVKIFFSPYILGF